MKKRGQGAGSSPLQNRLSLTPALQIRGYRKPWGPGVRMHTRRHARSTLPCALGFGGAQRGGRGAVDSRRQRSWSWCQLELEIFDWNPHRNRWGRQYARDLYSPGNLESRSPSLRSGVTGFPIEKKNGVKNWGRGENLRHESQVPFCLKDRATEAQRGPNLSMKVLRTSHR